MPQYSLVRVALLIIYFLTSGTSENLRCGSLGTKDTCRCVVKFDEVTSMAIVEAQCQYLELQEFPTPVSEEVINSLDVSHNDLEQLEAADVSKSLGSSLISLSFCHNSISDIENVFFDSFPNLIKLDLSHNYLQTLEPKELFDKLEKLQDLDLSYNEIDVLPDGIFASLKNLRKIDLSYNPLYQILQDPTALTNKLQINENLKYLGLDNVGITKIHAKCWNHFKALEHLSIADNPLDEVPQTSDTLEYLDISGTNITNLHENDLKYPNLKTLKMSRMENLTSVSAYAFYNLGILEELILTDSSSLSEFSGVAFGGLDRHTFPRKFKKFDLARNRLSSLNETYKFIFQELDTADISLNPWSCDCGVLWMKEMDAIMMRKSDIRCSSPNDMINKMVVELEPKDVPNCYPGIYGKKSHQTALLILLMVVFVLIVVIIYLCLYSPSWSIKIGSTKMSPDSPYSINNEQI
ncbi:chondroadherin-like [Coccinella septempunctata]|uniref:chondroadherin-like n=1 Tax=Coccinella septempunctata TaxID=41139 RepID=UPI001D08CA85|nr:chondroadherin-like [Coccinella septempunctata]